MRSNAVIVPNRGLYFDRPALALPRGALKDGYNFRVKNGQLSNLNLGWTKFSSNWTLNGPVTLIDNFFPRSGDEQLIFGSLTDLYLYDAVNDAVTFITPTYATGTAAVSGTAVTGTGTTWSTNAAAGDQISFGSATENDPGATWYSIQSVDSDTGITLTATAGTVADGPYTIRKLFTGNRTDIWDFDTFVNDAVSGDDLWIATNGVDPVVSWNGTDAAVTLNPQLGFTCKTVTTFSNMVLYGNLVESGVAYPTSFTNSDISKPLLVGSTGTGVSDQFVVHDGTDGIVNMIPIGDYLVFYAERHVVMAQFAGDPYGFIFRPAASGLGPIGPNAIADFGDFHEFIGSDTQYSFDGVSVSEVNGHVFRDVLRRMDPLRKPLVFGHFDEENGDIIWSIPLTDDAQAGQSDGAAEKAFSEHYLEDMPDGVETPFSSRSFPFTASGFYERAEGLTWDQATGSWQDYNYSWNDRFFSLAFPQNITGDVNGQIYILGEAQDADGTDLASYVRFGRVATGSGRERNLLTRVYPFAQTFDGDLTVTIWMTDHAAGPTVSKGAFAFDQNLPEGGHFVSVFRAGRYMELQFGTPGNPWVLEGYDVDVRSGGQR